MEKKAADNYPDKGRRIIGSEKSYELREPVAFYEVNLLIKMII